MEDFYNAMTTYIDSKKPKEICLHARTIKKNGWETCLDCRSRLSRIFCNDPYSNVGGYNFTEPKECRFSRILPLELFNHTRELCMTCLDHLDKNVKCHMRNLCAAVLWKKVKYLYPKSITLTKFSKRVGVSVPTITKTCKKLK